MAFISNGTTILDNGSFSASLGSLVFISEQTASSSSSVSFTSGIDSTYPIYKFEFIDIHCSSSEAQFQVSYTTDGSNFNATQTSTFVGAYHGESGGYSGVAYYAGSDVAQGSDAGLGSSQSSNNDASLAGTLQLFNPSSTVFVKHWIAENNLDEVNATNHNLMGGYVNTTSAVTGVRFKFNSGNIDSGTIKLYGIKDS